VPTFDVAALIYNGLRKVTPSNPQSRVRKAQRAATALRAVTEIMTDRLQEFKQHHPLPDRGFLAELSGLFSLVQHLSVRADVEVADATMYWDISARPVLLESRVAMPLVEQLTVKAA
jgi:hypothetical protein